MKKEKLVLVGNGMAGMRTLEELLTIAPDQYDITVFGAEPHGNYNRILLSPVLAGEKTVEQIMLNDLDWYAARGITLHAGKAVTQINRARRQVIAADGAFAPYDRLLLATGSDPIILPVPGNDLPGVITFRDIQDVQAMVDAARTGRKHAVVIGGGLLGLEAASGLMKQGMEVTVVHLLDVLMERQLDTEAAALLRASLEERGLRFLLGAQTVAILGEERVRGVRFKDGLEIPADLVVMAVGVRPATALVRAAGLELGPRGGVRVDAQMRTSDPHIFAAGDMVEVVDAVTGEPAVMALAGPANRQGRIVADTIAGRPSAYTTTQGTAIVKIFEMTGAITGASEKVLQKLGRPYRKVYLHPSGHAGYYPGTAQMHMKLLFAPDDGTILGAQIVGFDGVDKRIDVLATALRAKMTVFDLERLELAYAPPYGSAKDPINMAGFIAGNLLRGDVALWYAEDYPAATEDALIVDVRGEQEYDEWHIDGALHLPLPQLRERIVELRERAGGRRVLLYCMVGFRSYVAYRILAQHGFQGVATLAGGGKTFTSYHRTRLATGQPSEPFVAHAEEDLHAQQMLVDVD